MRRFHASLLVLSVALAWCLPSFAAGVSSPVDPARADFHVAPNGSDENPGTREQPFATLARARDAVREKVRAGLANDVVVAIRGGVYRIEEALRFGPEDSGTERHSITYAAYPGESPVLSGGRAIEGWKAEPDGSWSAKVPEAKPGRWTFRELFVNGERRTRARQPNEGFYRVVQVGEDKRTSFTYGEGEVRRYDDLAETELVFLHDWSTSRIALKEVDESARRVTLTYPVGQSARHYAMDWFEKEPRYYLEGSRSFLDVPGEWHLDDADDVLRYVPREGEQPEQVEAVAPVAEALLVVRGEPGKGAPVRNVRFVGLSFEHCAWTLPEGGYASGQAGFHEDRSGDGGTTRVPIPAAVTFEVAESCELRDCRVAHTGGSGVWLGSRCRDCFLEGCVVTDVSGNGVMIGEDRSRLTGGKPWWQSAPQEAASGQVVRDCLIERCGQQFFGAVGVWVGLAQRTSIIENEIARLPYTGVSVGWMWNPTPTPCKENVVERNHIHHVMQVLSDGGGIYTLGTQPGTKLRENVIHDVPLNLGRAESNGMFLDEGTEHIVIERNVIHDVDRSPLRFHKAEHNLVRDNVLLVREGVLPIRYNATPEETIETEGNLVQTASGLSPEAAWRLAEAVRLAGRGATKTLGEAERAFRDSLSGAVLEGRWCLLSGGTMGEERTDKYTIEKVGKVGGDIWLFLVRIEYGGKDLKAPVPVRVLWAGTTPVVTLDDLGIPGVGTFSARVVFHGDSYAGTWSAPDHAGLMFGVLHKPR